MHRRLKLIKSISLILISLLLWHVGGLRVYAQTRSVARRPQSELFSQVGLKAPVSNRFDTLLKELKDVVKQGAEKTKAAPERGFAAIDKLAELKAKLIAENEKNQSYFNQIEEIITDKSMGAEILSRYQSFVNDYQSKYQQLLANLESIESAHKDATGLWGKLSGRNKGVEWNEVCNNTLNFLDENIGRPTKSTFDPHNLPHRSLKLDKPVLPKLTRQEWDQALSTDSADSTDSKATGSATLVEQRSTPKPLNTSPPTAADLAETIEVKFTSEIRQLAQSLQNNPVKIFNWVRNNIDFVPTWGSIQGAQLCMETKSCNAFDTSSLLIALLRVSGISARYQMGTIEVPIEQFKNWAGGFTDADAAASFFASGGIPSVVRRVNQSGQVVTVKLEHVWVKAFVDYGPSAASVQVAGDTWVEIDSSFKQHTVSSPLQNLTSVVPFSRDAYLSSPTDSSPTDFYRQTLITFIQQNHPGKTLDDFLYKKTIKTFAPSILSGALPYKSVILGPGFSSIPDQLRQQATIQVGQSSSSLIYTAPMATLLGKRLTLSFIPATSADVQVATGFGGLYRTPPYLMSVKPVLRLDGQEVAAGSPASMGQSLRMTFVLDLPVLGQRIAENTITAGVYLTILLAPHLVNDALGNKLAGEFRHADDRFGTLNIDNSDRDPSVGGGLQVFVSYYFKRLDQSMARLKEFFPVSQLKTVFAAYVSSDVEPSSLFGAPAALQFTGISIDADLLEDVTLAKDGTSQSTLSFEQLRGLESSYWEHGIFEPEGPDPNQPAISTVRALQRAKRTGITIHEINAANLSTIEPQLQVGPEVKEAIRDAIAAGLVVTTPASSLQLGSWLGVGYIVEDPLTGAGAYQISGGLSGGAITIPLLQPHLEGGALPPGQPQWPTAIIAVGWPVFGGALQQMVIRMFVNKWTVSDSIGRKLHSNGYNVYTADVESDTFVPFVAGTGARTNYDVFCYVGRTFADGSIALDNAEGSRSFPPGGIPRKFWVAYLSDNTGSICNPAGDTGSFTCSESRDLQRRWRDSLIPLVLDPALGQSFYKGALIGFTNTDSLIGSKVKADQFWAAMTGGSAADNAADALTNTYREIYPPGAVTLRGFGRP